MNQPTHDFRGELQVPLTGVMVAFGIIAVGVLLAVAPVEDLHRAVTATLLAASILVSAIAIFYLTKWQPQFARWFATLTMVVLVHLSRLWLGVSASLALSVLPPLFCGALLGLGPAVAIAALETVLAFLTWQTIGAVEMVGTLAGSLLAIWGAVTVMVASRLLTYRVADWAWEYYQQALEMIREAQERHVQLAQAVEDLAKANLHLARLNAMAQGLRQVAEDARTAKEQFVANVSHELRTPLNMITGFSEMILQTPQTYGRLPGRLLADLAVIHRNAEHLAHLIDDVLDLSQLETDQMALLQELVHFPDLVEAATVAVRPLYETKGLYLKTDIAPDLPPVYCDPTRIREVLLNLLSNAGRFTDEGGVDVRVWQSGGDVFVSVADTGPGISAQNLEKMFQPFFQADASTRRRYGGTGLGLSITKRFVELHGGTIWVKSKEGSGAAFVFRIPLTPPTMETELSFARGMTPGWDFLQRTRPNAGPKQRIRPRLVVMEPEGLLMRLMVRYFSGVDVVPATTAEEVADHLSQGPAQALLVTGSSPEENSTDLSALDQLPATIPIITCRVPKGSRSSASAKTEWLVKPVAREALLAILEKLGVLTGTVLVVDDDPDALQLFGRMLASSERGYKALLATDGQQALEVLEECHTDAILLDLLMPRLDGFEFLERRSRDDVLRDIPIVIISAQDPAGQPIVSSGLSVTQRGGLSARKLLQCVNALISVLAVGERGDDPALREVARDEPVFE